MDLMNLFLLQAEAVSTVLLMQVVQLVQVLLLSVPVLVSARSVKVLLKLLPVSRKHQTTSAPT